MTRRHLAWALLPLLVSGTWAGEAELARLLEILRQNGTITEVQYQELIGALRADATKTIPAAVLPDTPQVAEVHVDSSAGGVEVAAYDGESWFRLGGGLALDAVSYSESGMGDGAELRRARLELQGGYHGDFGYALELDFAGDEVDVKDVYLDYLAWHPVSLRIGHFKEPFGLEPQTSFEHLTFMERALPDELAPGRSLGIGLHRLGSDWTLAGGVFAHSLNQEAEEGTNQGWGVTARATWAPWHEEERAIHLGLSGAYRAVKPGDYLRFRRGPESHLTGIEFLDTGKKSIADASALQRVALESAAVWGPLSLQGEYLWAGVERRDSVPALDFAGWYLQGSWFLTGESRYYRYETGDFGRVRPQRSSGAWELALRYSALELNDAEIDGGRERNLTLGVNWYLEPQLRLMANYTRVYNDRQASNNGDLASGDNPRILQMRLQADF